MRRRPRRRDRSRTAGSKPSKSYKGNVGGKAALDPLGRVLRAGGRDASPFSWRAGAHFEPAALGASEMPPTSSVHPGRAGEAGDRG